MSALGRFKDAMARGTQWRYLLVFVVGTLLPSTLAFAPSHHFFGDLFDHSTREPQLVARLDSPALFEVLRQLGEPGGASVMAGVTMSLFFALVFAPALAGAAAAVAGSEVTLNLSALLGASARMYLRMLRLTIVSVLPLGIAAGIGGAIVAAVGKANAHAVLESTASRNATLAWLATTLLVLLAQSTVETGRAFLAAEPEKRSAWKAWWRGVKLTVRRPGPVLGTYAGLTALSLLAAAVLTALRLRLFPSGAVTIGLELVLAQVVVAAIGWGRASRLSGLVSIVQSEGSKPSR